MQSTGQTSTHELSFCPMQGSAMTYAKRGTPSGGQRSAELYRWPVPGQRDADPFADSFTGLIAARAVSVAVELGLFEALHEHGPATAEELSERLGLDPLGAETLAAALVPLGYLEREDGRVANAEVAERLLVSSSPESIATFVGGQGDLHWDVLSGLAEAVSEGRPYALHEERRDERERWAA